MMMKAFGVLLVLLVAGSTGQQTSSSSSSSSSCGVGTYFAASTSECFCSISSPFDNGDDSNVIRLAALFDTTGYDWGPDVVDVTVQLINRGWWSVLPPDDNGTRLEYHLEDAACDESTAVRRYWGLRTANGNKPMHGLLAARCSAVSIALARIAGLEAVPQVSFASTSSVLSNKNDFPTFSRLVAIGEVGALIAMMRLFGWERIGILATDTAFSKNLIDDLRTGWVGEHDGWQGQVAFSDTIRLAPDGTVDGDSVRQVLESIPTDPDVTSRVIFLAAHSEHAFKILEQAKQVLPKDTIWVGPSSWTAKDDLNDHPWLPSTPGFLGVAPFRNRDAVYQEFLEQLQEYQSTNGKKVLQELPTFAAELVDSIRALTSAIVRSTNRRDGEQIVGILRSLVFDGVSGHVEFTEEGDRKDPRFSFFNAQRFVSSQDRAFWRRENKAIGSGLVGDAFWGEIGTAGTDVASASFTNGLEKVCFPQVDCGVIPDDTYPPPPYKMPIWAIFVIIFLVITLVALVGVTLRYRSSRRSKIRDRAELESLRKSVVGMSVAECTYIPRTSSKGRGDIEQAMDSLSGSFTLPSTKSAIWMWQETQQMMSKQSSDSIFGDPKDCWILYTSECTQRIEAAYKKGLAEFSPLAGYTINFAKMEQTKVATGFTRRVQRVLGDDDSSTSQTIDLQTVEVGVEFPAEIIDEPRMVLCEDDIIQISKQRSDGWAFGTKLHHADEATARQLVAVAAADDSNLMTDTGWFPLDKTRTPTSDDLKPLQQNVGDAGALDPPKHWDKVDNASVVQKHLLSPGDTERAKVEQAFLSTLDERKVRVLSIERIQNLAMWQSYVVKRQTICNREICNREADGHTAKSDSPAMKAAMERFERSWLWHGTNADVMDKITQQGFNRSFCGKNATYYGKGVYLARDSSYSAQTLYAVPDNRGKQYIMACRVVVGEYCLGVKDAPAPGVRDHKRHALYDSTVNSMSNPSVFVTYHDAQAYPEYLITFKHDERGASC